MLLILTALVLCAVNYKPDTMLSGWDTLHPEFDFPNYWRRILQSVWQEHQGLGAVATQAHASEIPHILFLQFFDLFLPVIAIRWAYFFVMLVIGPVGVYFFTDYLFGKKSETRKYSFLAGLFYLLNLATLQQFYVPLEMFATLYGYIGFLFLFALRYLKEKSRSRLLFFSIFTLLALPMAHTSTLWFVYFSLLSLFLVCEALLRRHRLSGVIKRVGIILLVSIVINASWLFPNIFFLVHHASEVQNATITRLFSEEAILNNQEYGTLSSISTLKGFLFNWNVSREGEIFTPLFIRWVYYYSIIPFHLWYVLSGCMALGAFSILYQWLKRKSSTGIPIVSIAFFCVFVLFMNDGPLGFLFNLLQSHFPLFKEAFRLPYTKVSIPLAFAYSILLAYGTASLSAFVSRIIPAYRLRELWNASVVVIITLLLVVLMWPAFRGDLFGNIEKVQVPQDYKSAFEFLNVKSGKRIATLPVHTLYGWLYFNWSRDRNEASYQGAGFSWFYSHNPILEREFDRWFPTNEEFYKEFSYAVYSENASLLKYVLNKYQVDYLLWDRSVISPGSERALFTPQTEKLLSLMPNVKKEKEFGKLSVYSVMNQDTPQDYVYAPEMIFPITEKYGFSNVDAYGSVSMNDTIVATPVVSPNGVTYPFSDDRKLSQQISRGTVFEVSAPTKGGETTISVPTFPKNEPLPARLTLNENTVHIQYLYPSIHDAQGMPVFSKNYSDTVTFSKPLSESLILFQNTDLPVTDVLTQALVHSGDRLVAFSKKASEIISFSDSVYSAVATDCEGGSGGFGKSLDPYPGSVSLEAKDKNTCMSFTKTISVSQPSVLRVGFTYKQTVGARAMYCLSRAGISDCENKKYARSPLASADWQPFGDYVNIETPGEYVFTVILETDNKREAQTASFRNITVAQYPITETIPIIPNEAAYSNDHAVYESTLSASQFPLRVELPIYGEVSKTYGAGSPYFASEKRNCDQFNNKAFDRVLQDGTDGRLAFSYSATDAISCDSIDTRSIDPLASYAITFKSTHYEGKGLDVCVAATNLDKCLIQDRLKGGMETFILPAYPSVEQVRVSIGNQSIGRVVTRNDLSFVTAQYIPYLWLKGMSLAPQGKNLTQNPLNVSRIHKKAIYKYEIDTAISPLSSPEQKGYLVLNQSYEKGWVLYDRTSCLFGLTTPLTCKKAESVHTTAKNWANAWIVPPIASSYVIIFWPQYLQFFGYTLLGMLFIGMIVWWVRSRKAE